MFSLNYKGNLSFYTGFLNSSTVTVLLRKLLKGTEAWNMYRGKGLVSKCKVQWVLQVALTQG